MFLVHETAHIENLHRTNIQVESVFLGHEIFCISTFPYIQYHFQVSKLKNLPTLVDWESTAFWQQEFNKLFFIDLFFVAILVNMVLFRFRVRDIGYLRSRCIHIRYQGKLVLSLVISSIFSGSSPVKFISLILNWLTKGRTRNASSLLTYSLLSSPLEPTSSKCLCFQAMGTDFNFLSELHDKLEVQNKPLQNVYWCLSTYQSYRLERIQYSDFTYSKLVSIIVVNFWQ